MIKKTNFSERYQRQITLKGFGKEAQAKLLSAKLLVIGAGGLGSPALQYLVAAGVGTIGIADNDVVSLSNLHRQVLYSTEDIGSLKADVAAKKLRRLNPEITIVPYALRLTNANALDIIRQFDYILDGTDNFASRYMINDACILLEKPLIYGAVSQYEGQVAVFNVKSSKGEKVNYRHLFPQPPKEGEVANCAEAGVLGVLAGIIGTMQATEAIKLITGIGEPLVNKLLIYNLLSNFFYEMALISSDEGVWPKTETEFLAAKYGDACSVADTSAFEIDANQFIALRQKPSATVIDVREPGELPLVKGFIHQQIPMSVFKERIAGISEQTILIFCQHGIRSLLAAEIVRERFGSSKEVYSLKGGLVKWQEEL